jgi:acyl-CoA thioester hydrolase
MQFSTLLSNYHSIIEVPIAWGDMDAAQHVNNIMYLRYFESGRIQYMEDIGYGFGQDSIGIILAEVNCKYRIPITFPDKVWVGTRAMMETMDESSIWTEQVIVSQKLDKISTISTARLVSYDYQNLCKAPWPQVVIEGMQKLEKS